jgi:hypothetical protein
LPRFVDVPHGRLRKAVTEHDELPEKRHGYGAALDRHVVRGGSGLLQVAAGLGKALPGGNQLPRGRLCDFRVCGIGNRFVSLHSSQKYQQYQHDQHYHSPPLLSSDNNGITPGGILLQVLEHQIIIAGSAYLKAEGTYSLTDRLFLSTHNDTARQLLIHHLQQPR